MVMGRFSEAIWCRITWSSKLKLVEKQICPGKSSVKRCSASEIEISPIRLFKFEVNISVAVSMYQKTC
jgi:hypothetical protein